MLTKFRQNKGFTLVEVLVVVVILAILAAIAVPIYLHYVESARASEAQEAIGKVMGAAEIYHSENGRWPSSVEQMTRLQLNPLTLNRWHFTITGGGQGITQIRAISTGQMPGGAGKSVIYNAQDGAWSGYGND